MAEWSFDQANRVATVLAPATAVTIQELYDEFRHHEGSMQSMGEPRHLDAAGKFDLGGGIVTVVSVRLEDGWQVGFEARPGPTYETCQITGGNLGAVDSGGNPIWPIYPFAFTTVSFAQATTGGLADPVEFDQIVSDISQIQTDISQINSDVAATLSAITGLTELELAEKITNPATGKLEIVNDTAMRRWEANAWEDAAKSTPYQGAGLEAVSEITEIAY